MFGGICRKTGDCFLYAVENRTKDLLMLIIKSRIVAGSKLNADEWKSYNDIEKSGFEHQIVKHFEHFVGPTTSP